MWPAFCSTISQSSELNGSTDTCVAAGTLASALTAGQGSNTVWW